MKSKKIIKIAIPSIIILFLIFNASVFASVKTKPAPSVILVKKVISSIPVRIKIPAMNIDAVVESTGLTKQGSMDVPKGHTNAGWYNLGTIPGDIGSAVIAGHVGRWLNGDISVFNDLTKLKKGDVVYIQNKLGATISFKVTATKIYTDNQNAPDVFTSSDGLAHLNLVTCTGAYDKATNSYSSRLVVFTDKV